MEQETKNKVGRPQKMNAQVIQELEEVFALGGSDKEACFYANISKSLLYNYQKENPEFLERKNALKESPILKARREVVKGLEGNPEFSLKYLERKKKKEFAMKVEHEHEVGDESKQDLKDIVSLLTKQ